MKNFYVALIEADNNPEENEGQAFVKAMNDLKETGKKIGNVTYYRVADEKQYRKAEKDFKAQVNK